MAFTTQRDTSVYSKFVSEVSASLDEIAQETPTGDEVKEINKTVETTDESMETENEENGGLPLEDLPDVVFDLICEYLHLKDIGKLGRVNKAIRSRLPRFSYVEKQGFSCLSGLEMCPVSGPIKSFKFSMLSKPIINGCFCLQRVDATTTISTTTSKDVQEPLALYIHRIQKHSTTGKTDRNDDKAIVTRINTDTDTTDEIHDLDELRKFLEGFRQGDRLNIKSGQFALGKSPKPVSYLEFEAIECAVSIACDDSHHFTPRLDHIHEEIQDPSSKLEEAIKLIMTGHTDVANTSRVTSAVRGTEIVRKMVSIVDNPPIQDVIDHPGLVPKLISYLALDSNELLQFEAAWAVTNLVSGASQQTTEVVAHGAIPAFIHLMANSPRDGTQEQAVWGLGNIAGDGPPCRDAVLEQGALEHLLVLMTDCIQPGTKQNHSRNTLRNCAWFLSNLCRGKNPHPDFSHVSKCLPMLRTLLDMSVENGVEDDADVSIDACWSVSYLSDGPNVNLDTVIESGVCIPVMALLKQCINKRVQTGDLITPALRCIGNVVSGSDTQTQVMLDLDVLDCLAKTLDSHSQVIKKETCWALSNIAAGTKVQVEMILTHDNGSFLPKIVEIVLSAGDDATYKLRKEGTWVLSNITSGLCKEHIDLVVEKGGLEALAAMVAPPHNEHAIKHVVLETLQNILKTGKIDDSDESKHAARVSKAFGEFFEDPHTDADDIHVMIEALVDTYPLLGPISTSSTRGSPFRNSNLMENMFEDEGGGPGGSDLGVFGGGGGGF